jgi:hypothetical protein
VLKRRFVDVDGHPDLVAIRKAREQSKGRWLGFGLGVLPNFIKICACSGIPGTLLYSSMFVAPWVAFELLILIGDPSQPSSLDGSRVQSPPSLSRRLWALWGVTIASIFPVYSPAYNPKQIPYQELQLVSYNMLGALCIGFILSLAASTVFIDFRDNQGDLVVVTWTILLLGCFLQFLGTVLVGKGILSLYSNLEAVVIGVVSLFFTYRNAYPIARAMIRGRLQTVASSQALHGVFAVLSIYTLLSWIFWYYAVFFDETDTYMPDWLKYLG